MSDHRVGGIQNIGGRAIVLLQTNHLSIWKMLFKQQNIFDGCAAEFIDTLIIVAHHTKVFEFRGQKRNQTVLQGGCILILIYHDIAKSSRIFCKDLGVAFKKLHRL